MKFWQTQNPYVSISDTPAPHHVSIPKHFATHSPLNHAYAIYGRNLLCIAGWDNSPTSTLWQIPRFEEKLNKMSMVLIKNGRLLKAFQLSNISSWSSYVWHLDVDIIFWNKKYYQAKIETKCAAIYSLFSFRIDNSKPVLTIETDLSTNSNWVCFWFHCLSL